MDIKRKADICRELKEEMEKAGFKSAKRFFGSNGKNISKQTKDSERAKQKMTSMFYNMLSYTGGDLEIIKVVCAVLNIDAYERYPDLIGAKRREDEKKKNVFTENMTEKQKGRLKKYEEENNVKTYCESKWGAWFVLNKNQKQEETKTIQKLIEYIEARHSLIGEAIYYISQRHDDIERWTKEIKEAKKKLEYMEVEG